MEFKKVDVSTRFIAALIDGVVGWVVVFIPFIGGIISMIYLLLKDGIMYQITKQEDWKNRSIGKKLMNLEVVRLDGGLVDLSVSAKRNIPLAIGSLIAIIPVLGWILGFLVALVFSVIEIILVVSDEKGRRMGDRWADTQVINSKAVNEAKQADIKIDNNVVNNVEEDTVNNINTNVDENIDNKVDTNIDNNLDKNIDM